MEDTIGQRRPGYDDYSRGERVVHGRQASVTPAFTTMAMKTVLKKNDATMQQGKAAHHCVRTCTSETWAVIPTTKE